MNRPFDDFKRNTLGRVLAPALTTQGARAVGGDKVQTVEQLRAALRQSRFVSLAFIRGDEMRLCFANGEQRLMFNTDWDRARLQVQGFSSHVTELKFDASPPALPKPEKKWRKPKVLAHDQWQRFARSAAEPLVPAEIGHGVYLQYSLGEAVVFREAAGEIRMAGWKVLSYPDQKTRISCIST